MLQSLVILLLLFSRVRCQIYAPVYISNWTFSQLIPADYDKSQPPIETSPDGKLIPLSVSITVNVSQLITVNSAEQSYTVDLTYSQRWKDDRLHLPQKNSGVKTIPLGTKWRDQLWIPEIFLANSIQPIMMIMTPLFMEIDMENESLISTSRQVVKLRCAMNLFHFPLDEQVCPIEFTLLRNPRDRAFVKFDETSTRRIDFPNYFIIQSIHKDVEECVSIRGEDYSCVAAKLELFRKFSYYLIRIYSPSCLLVVTAFVGFWVPPMGHSARTALIVTPLLALITQQTMISSEVNVSYLVAIHIWMIFNTSFVFLSLVEYACAVVYAHIVDDRRDAEKTLTFTRKSGGRLSRWSNTLLRIIYGTVPFDKNPMDRNKVDYMARILFPLAYFSFVVIYFAIFLGPWVMHVYHHEDEIMETGNSVNDSKIIDPMAT